MIKHNIVQFYAMSYPTQEEELLAKEAAAKNQLDSEEQEFLNMIKSIPSNNVLQITELAKRIIKTFDNVMDSVHRESYERQEDMAVGMKKLLEEEQRVIEARRGYVLKLSSSSVR